MGTERPRERLVPPHRGGRGWEEPGREPETTKRVGVEKFLETAAAEPVPVLWAQFPPAGGRVRSPYSWDPRALGTGLPPATRSPSASLGRFPI